MSENLYAEREIMSPELLPHYLRHLDRMTAEGLYAKSAIAAELAYRDLQIETLRQTHYLGPWQRCKCICHAMPEGMEHSLDCCEAPRRIATGAKE